MKLKAERLVKYINEGVLSYMEGNGMYNELDVIVEKISELDGGSYIYNEISIEGVINEFDSKCGLSFLAETVLDDHRVEITKKCIDIVNNEQEIDLNALKKILKLRDWATVDDVVEKIKFLFG